MKNKTILFVLALVHITVSYAQIEKETYTIQGKVYDAATNKPVEGLSVFVPDYSATFTFPDGSFTLEIPSRQAVIKIEGLDYNNVNVPVKGRDSIKVFVYNDRHFSYNDQADIHYLKESQTYTNGAVSTFRKNGDEWKEASTSAESFFDDQIPGLNVIRKSGVHGIGSNMVLRGYNSLYCNNQPLIVVDGYIFDIGQYGEEIIGGYKTNALMYIDENDIESVTVLKDATTLYGAKGGNGVIFIKTNHAKKMATKIDFSINGGVNYCPENLPVMNAEQYKSYLSDLLETSDLSGDQITSLPYFNEDPSFSEYYKYHNNTNWQDQVIANSYNQNYKLKISGGDEVAMYMVSLGYQKYNGLVKNTDFSRFNLRFNPEININKKLFVNSNISVTVNVDNLKDDGVMPESNPIFLSRVKAPILYPNERDAYGNISPNIEDVDIFNVSNPLAVIENVQASSRNYRFMAFINADYKVVKDLVISNMLGINFDKVRDMIFRPDIGMVSVDLQIDSSRNSSTQNISKLFSLNNDFRITYSKSFLNAFHFTGIAGARTNVNDADGYWSKDYNTPSDEYINLGNGDENLIETDGFDIKWNSLTFYASANLDYFQKYILSLNTALDGSSRFGDDVDGISLLSGKFGVFPSVAGAWLMSSENFLKDISWIELLKLRVSYGISGNDDIGYYSYQKLYTTQNYMSARGIVVGSLSNPTIRWEEVKKINAGLDISLMRERLNLSLDIYQNKTEGLLNYTNPVSYAAAFDSYIENNGIVENKGMDLRLDVRIVNTKFKWDMGIVYSKNKSEVIEFPNEEVVNEVLDGYIQTKTGQPLTVFYGYKTLGVISSVEEATELNLKDTYGNSFGAGDIHFQDLDKNGVSDNIINHNDMTVIGDPNPDFSGMLSNRFSWKGLSLDIIMSFSYGNDIYNYQRYQLEASRNPYNQLGSVVNRWRYDGQETDMPKASYDDPMGNARFSDRWIEDGSYMKLKKVTLSYNIPMQHEMLQGIEFFVSGYNLVTISGYRGQDPEFSLVSSPLYHGIDVGLVPQYRSFYAGVRFGL